MAAKRYLIADLSNNQASVDLRRVKQSGIVGFWHKVSEGQNYTDPFWTKRRDHGRIYGLRVGGYHFARPSSTHDAQAEAVYFLNRLGDIHRRDLAPVLDLEVSDSLQHRQLANWAHIWMQTVHAALGVWPLFYSYPAFIHSMAATHVLGRGLW